MRQLRTAGHFDSDRYSEAGDKGRSSKRTSKSSVCGMGEGCGRAKKRGKATDSDSEDDDVMANVVDADDSEDEETLQSK